MQGDRGKSTIFVPIIGLHGCQGGRKKHINYTTRSSSQAGEAGTSLISDKQAAVCQGLLIHYVTCFR